MWNDSHADETWVDCLKRYMRMWKRRYGASDGTICDEIVKLHNATGLAGKTGIRFAPGSADEYNRMKANAARITRMLTDEPNTEFESFQLFNMLPSILSAMPADLRIEFLNEYMAPLGLTARSTEESTQDSLNATNHLVTIAKEASEAQSAVASLINDPSPAQLAKADRELAEAEEAIHAARVDVHQQLTLRVGA